MTKKNPRVSVVIATKNEEKNINTCLVSIKKQVYKNIEIIVVDNYSNDSTAKFARKYTKSVFSCGPERSAQRNFGAKLAKGKYLLFLDADMIIGSSIVEDCIKTINQAVGSQISGIIIPEESIGSGFWARCKALERSFYISVDSIEAARFFPKIIFEKISGYDENLIAGEDWDLSNRIREMGEIKRIKTFIYHNEGKLSYIGLMKKKVYYASIINNYVEKNRENIIFKIVSNRFILFFSKPSKLFKNPVIGLGMLFMVFSEFAFGGVGYLARNFQKR